MKAVDRIFGWLLVLGSVLHCGGSFAVYKSKPDLFLWAEAGGLAGLLVAALNILRVSRPNDRPLAWVSFAGCLGHLAVAIGFGAVIGNPFDPRPLTHAIIALVLAAFS